MAAVWSSAKVLELDFSGIEAVLLGWLMRDPDYLRLAKLGMHAYVASHVLKRPADLSWPDAQLADYFKAIKHSEDPTVQDAYSRSKRTVHAKGYGQTVHGLLKNNPKLFKSLKDAQMIDDVYCAVAPSVPVFHTAVRDTAYHQHFLGGADAYTYDPVARRALGHPYAYQHWFWSVVAYERLTITQRLWREKRGLPLIEIAPGQWYGVTLGEDAKRCIAFLPQSTARGVLTDAAMALFDPASPHYDHCHIGDLYYGATPLRAPIHDSFLLEVPTRMVDRCLERAARAMQMPIARLPCPAEWGLGSHLTIGVDAKMGDDWGSMSPVGLPSLVDLGVANDTPYSPAEDEDEDDVSDLETRMGVAS